MLNVCQACTCRFAVDLKTCPQCGSEDFVHESLLEAAPEQPDPTPAAGSTPPPSSPGSSAGPPEGGPG